MEIVAFLTALLPILGAVIEAIKQHGIKKDAAAAVDAPLAEQGEIDAELVGDLDALSIRMQRVHEAIRAHRRRAG